MSTASDLTPLLGQADNAAEEFVLPVLQQVWGLTVKYSDRVRSYEFNRDTATIWLPNGLDWIQKHCRIDRCWLHWVGGDRLAPEFSAYPGANGNVIPMLRRPW